MVVTVPESRGPIHSPLQETLPSPAFRRCLYCSHQPLVCAHCLEGPIIPVHPLGSMLAAFHHFSLSVGRFPFCPHCMDLSMTHKYFGGPHVYICLFCHLNSILYSTRTLEKHSKTAAFGQVEHFLNYFLTRDRSHFFL